MRGDEVLRNDGGGGGAPGGAPAGGRTRWGRSSGGRLNFGEDEYYLAFLGTPSTTTPWMLQFGGHHLAINLTMAGSQATHGAEPAGGAAGEFHVRRPEIRPLGKENDKALRADQRARREAARPGDPRLRASPISCSGPARTARRSSRKASARRRMTPAQQTMLLEHRPRMGRHHDRRASPSRAWPRSAPTCRRPISRGAARPPTAASAYFRIQGPTLVIEYAPQGSVDHIHTIYRDPTNDYGAKFAAK